MPKISKMPNPPEADFIKGTEFTTKTLNKLAKRSLPSNVNNSLSGGDRRHFEK